LTLTSTDSVIIRCPACGTSNRVPRSTEGRAGKCGSCHATLPPLYSAPVELTDATFAKFLLQYPGLVLAEFWAPW
jgi:thioredoxin 2